MDPSYYSIKLARYGGTKAEVTGTLRAGLLRFTYPAGEKGTVVIEPNVKLHEGYVEVRPDGTIAGYNPVRRVYQGNGELAGFNGYFVVKFERKAETTGTWCGAKTTPGSAKQEGGCPRMGAYATFAAGGRPVVVKVGTSMTSLEEAEKNLTAELPAWNFEATRAASELAWKKWLGRIWWRAGRWTSARRFTRRCITRALGRGR